ncbi:MAG: SWIM zinc finger family protein [Bdellovibrionaceae bacterium]|nr:SWIM zinc finger family protein [Bdellovibrio sp.]
MSDQVFCEKWERFFKPETRSAGRTLYAKGVVAASRPSDNQVQAYIKGTQSFKVTFKCDNIESDIVFVDCTCPQSKKGLLCKHAWATLLKIENSYADFLELKTNLEKTISKEAGQVAGRAPRVTSQTQLDSQAAYRQKQAEYRKQQYQKQKQLHKDQKKTKKNSPMAEAPKFPALVAEAVEFFNSNGFHMESPLNAEVVGMAKKRLSRVFHPDIGGSHSEILELNKNYEIIINFIKSQSK